MVLISNKLLRFFRDLSITYKLLLGYTATFVIALFLANILSYSLLKKTVENSVESELKKTTTTVLNMIETTVDASIKNYLRAVAESNLGIVQQIYTEFESGRISEQGARTKATQIIMSQKIGQSGYIYCINSEGLVVVHPQEGVLGKNFIHRGFIKEQIKRKTGYLQYEWKNPGELVERQKALYMTYFEPWDWIISVSSYPEEFLDLININDFRDKIDRISFWGSGYFFVLNSKGDVITHPKLSGNLLDAVDAKGNEFVREIIQKKNGSILYSWKNPGEDTFRKKIAYFFYIPEYDWIVVSSCYLDEAHRPLSEMKKIMVLTGLAFVLLAIAITYLLSSFIIKPLKDLMSRFATAESGDFSVRAPDISKDEIGQLGRYLNRFMDELQTTNDKLVKEFQERIQSEVALRESEKKYRNIVENIDEAIFTLDTNGRITYISSASKKIMGYSPDYLIGKICLDFIHEEDQGQLRKGLQSAIEGHSEPNEYRIIHKSGELRWAKSFSNPIIDDGETIGIRGVLTDITAEKRARQEKQKLETQLIQAQKMEAIGTLAGGIAHDFNNILSAIFGYTELIRIKLPSESPFHELLEQVTTAAERAKDLVQQILLFSRQTNQVKKQIQPHLVIREALKLLRSSIPTTIEIKQNVPSNCESILADPTQIHQIVMNLCTNAYHAMREEGGVLGVNLSRIDITMEDFSSTSLDIDPGQYLMLEIADTGSGMDQATMEKIFDPYFTTKPRGEGTGLGLSVVHGIVKDSGGHIRVYSEPGEGTNIKIFFPRLEIEEDTKKGQIEEDIPTGSERILVVDDEETILDISKSILENLGYIVVTHISSEDALEAFQTDSDNFDLVITDMTMPNMTGLELSKKILAIHSQTPIILCTGFSEMMNKEIAQSLGIRRFLQKPFLIKDLAIVVRQVLD